MHLDSRQQAENGHFSVSARLVNQNFSLPQFGHKRFVESHMFVLACTNKNTPLAVHHPVSFIPRNSWFVLAVIAGAFGQLRSSSCIIDLCGWDRWCPLHADQSGKSYELQKSWFSHLQGHFKLLLVSLKCATFLSLSLLSFHLFQAFSEPWRWVSVLWNITT